MALKYEIQFNDNGAAPKIRTVGNEFATLDGKAQKAGKGLDKFSKSAESSTKKTDLLKTAVGAAVGSAAVGAITSFVTKSVELFDKQAQAETKVANALKSTGNQIGYTKKELTDLASQMQGKTIFGDEVVLEAEALALTFTNIGKDVFPQVIETALDMSQFLGQDLKTTMTQLGKALNDPVKGMTALRKVGASLTDEQAKQVKEFMKSNDVMSAQNVILKELAVEYGGAATAAANAGAGGLKQFLNQIGDTQEKIGESLIPTIEFYTEKLQSLNTWIQTVIDSNNEFSNKEKTFSDLQGEASTRIDEQKTKLEELNKALEKNNQYIAQYEGKRSASVEAAKNRNKEIQKEIDLTKQQLQASETQFRGLTKLAKKQSELDGKPKQKQGEAQPITSTAWADSQKEAEAAMQARIQLMQQVQDAEDKAAAQTLERFKETEEYQANIINLQNEYYRSMMTDEQKAYAAIAERQTLMLDAGVDEIQVTEWVNSEIKKIEEKRIQEIQDAEKKAADESRQYRLSIMQGIGDTASNLSTTLSNLTELEIRGIEDKCTEQANLIESTYQSEIAAAGANANAKANAEARYQAKVAEMEAKKQKQIEAAQRKTFELTKQLDAVSAIMNTAVAVTMALSSAPPPINFGLAASVGAMGATEVALIESQKMATGGESTGRNNLTMMNEDGRPEFVLNNRGYSTLGREFSYAANHGASTDELSAMLGGGSGKQTVLNISVGGLVTDQRTIEEHLLPAVQKALRRVA